MRPPFLTLAAAGAATLRLLIEAAALRAPLPVALRLALLGLGVWALVWIIRRASAAARVPNAAWLAAVITGLALPLIRSNRAQMRVRKLVLQHLASAEAALTPDEKEL